ncbi:MAG: phage tail assembly chaperone [Asticcacaulis sp.]|nr:phage tail assembly chaperone [Asticcacaulis sp.]
MGNGGIAPPTASRSPLPVNGAGEDIWISLFRHGVLGLRLTPEAFWRLSWREWQMLTAAPEMAVLSRQALEDLMREFPDE